MQVLTRLHEAVGIDDFASTVDCVKNMVIDEEMAVRHDEALKLWEENDIVLERLYGEIGAMDGKMDAMDGKMDAMGGKILTMDGKMDTVDGKMVTMDGKIDTIIDMVGEIPKKKRQLNENLEGI